MILIPLKIIRLLALLGWIALIGVISIPVSFQRDRWRAVNGMCRMIQRWGKGLLWIFNIRLEIHGDIDAFKGGLLVSNHLGYMDIFVHSAVFGLRFAPKSDIRDWPILGAYTGLSRPVWVERTSRHKSKETMEEFRETMRHGIPLIVYPEGTSSDGKSGVLPFKSTPFEAVAQGDFAIQPVITIYRVPEGHPTPCWYGDMTLLPHIWAMLGMPEYVAEVHLLPQVHPEGRDRKSLADELHAMMSKEYDRIFNGGKTA